MPGRAAQRNDFLLGVNYWPRHTAMAWWKRFDVGEVDDEFAQIAEWGLHLVRFCLLWEDFQPRPDTVDRVRLGNLQTVLDLAWKYGLRTVPTLLVGNMSGIMWMPCWAFTDRPEEGTILQMCEGHYVRLQLRSPFDDPGMLRAEALLAREAAAAIGGHPALHSWDLANEIDQAYLPAGPDSGWLWALVREPGAPGRLIPRRGHIRRTCALPHHPWAHHPGAGANSRLPVDARLPHLQSGGTWTA
jgi:endo-1,4-beta-mannosidase